MSLSAVAYRKHPQHSDTGYNKWLELCGGVYTITVAEALAVDDHVQRWLSLSAVIRARCGMTFCAR
jgi:hypothetical protein